MSDLLRKLGGEEKTVGYCSSPVSHHQWVRGPIVRGVYLDRVEDAAVEPEIIAWLGCLGIEGAQPVLIGPTTTTDTHYTMDETQERIALTSGSEDSLEKAFLG